MAWDGAQSSDFIKAPWAVLVLGVLRIVALRATGACPKPVSASGWGRRRKRKQQERKGRHHRAEEKAWDLVPVSDSQLHSSIVLITLHYLFGAPFHSLK